MTKKYLKKWLFFTLNFAFVTRTLIFWYVDLFPMRKRANLHIFIHIKAEKTTYESLDMMIGEYIWGWFVKVSYSIILNLKKLLTSKSFVVTLSNFSINTYLFCFVCCCFFYSIWFHLWCDFLVLISLHHIWYSGYRLYITIFYITVNWISFGQLGEENKPFKVDTLGYRKLVMNVFWDYTIKYKKIKHKNNK